MNGVWRLRFYGDGCALEPPSIIFPGVRVDLGPLITKSACNEEGLTKTSYGILGCLSVLNEVTNICVKRITIFNTAFPWQELYLASEAAVAHFLPLERDLQEALVALPFLLMAIQYCYG